MHCSSRQPHVKAQVEAGGAHREAAVGLVGICTHAFCQGRDTQASSPQSSAHFQPYQSRSSQQRTAGVGLPCTWERCE